MRTARPVPVDQASLSRTLRPNSRARAAVPTRAIQTGEGRDSSPGAKEKRALMHKWGRGPRENSLPGSLPKGRVSTLPTACILPRPHLPEFTANRVAILEAQKRSPPAARKPQKRVRLPGATPDKESTTLSLSNCTLDRPRRTDTRKSALSHRRQFSLGLFPFK